MQIQRGIKYFKGAQVYQKILFRGVQIFRYIWTGGTKNGGSTFRVTEQLHVNCFAILHYIKSITSRIADLVPTVASCWICFTD